MAWEEILAGIGGGLKGGMEYYIGDLQRKDKLAKEAEDRKLLEKQIATKEEIAALQSRTALERAQQQGLIQQLVATIGAGSRERVATTAAGASNYAADQRLAGQKVYAGAWQNVTGQQVAGRADVAKITAASDIVLQQWRNLGAATVAQINGQMGIRELERKWELDQQTGQRVMKVTQELTDPNNPSNKMTRVVTLPMDDDMGMGGGSSQYQGTPGEGWSQEPGLSQEGMGLGQPGMPGTSQSFWNREMGGGGDINLPAPGQRPGAAPPSQMPSFQTPMPGPAMPTPGAGAAPAPGGQSLVTSPTTKPGPVPALPPAGAVAPTAAPPPPTAPAGPSSPQVTTGMARMKEIVAKLNSQGISVTERARLMEELRRLRAQTPASTPLR